ncbi:hypothetical protein K488DRAFT_48676, partial [Vararia minispora EC-137]
GGGIGGLVLARALSQHAHLRISVYEANAEFAGMGTGIGIFRRTWKILHELGLGEAMIALCGPANNERGPCALISKSDQPEGKTFVEIHAPEGGMKAAHRAEFHDTLIHSLKECENISLRTSKRLVRYQERDGSVNLHFSDGTLSQCDVLVGADGLRSAVRATMVDILSKSTSHADLAFYRGAVWSGFLVYRAVVPRERVEKENVNHRVFHAPLLVGGQEVTAFPISRGTAINVSVYVFDPVGAAARAPYPGRTIEEVTVSDVIGSFGSDWEPEVIQLLSCLQGLEIRRWAVSEVEELPTYSHGRVMLLGDAAHGMTPNLGMGAGQAIEDAYVLSQLLSHPQAALHVETALVTYSRIRRPFVSNIVRLARRNGLYYVHRGENGLPLKFLPETSFDCQTQDDKVDTDGRVHTLNEESECMTITELGRRISHSFAWTSESAEDQPRRALEIFEQTIAAF